MNTFLDSGPIVGTKYFWAARSSRRSVLVLGLGGALALGASSTAWAQAGANPFGGAAVANPFAGAAAAGGAGARTVYFYSGGAPAEARVGAWGNGEAAKATDIDYQSSDALRVTTRNLSEGIRFDLARPVDIAPYTAPGVNGLVRLRVRFASMGGFGGFPGGGFPGGFPGGGDPRGGDPRGGDPRGGFPGGFPGGGFPGGGFPGQGGGGPKFSPALSDPIATEVDAPALPRVMGEAGTQGNAQFGAPGGFPPGGFPPGGFPPGGGDPRGAGGQGFPGQGEGGGMGFAGPAPQRTNIERFQVTMVLERGALTGGVDFNLRQGQTDEAGWRLLTVPLSGMTATPGATGAVRRVILTSDKEDTWYLGEAALSVDSPEIAVSLRQPTDAPGAQVGEVTVRPGAITLVADVEAGSSDVALSWNFDADNAGAPMMAPVGFPGAGGPGMGDPRGQMNDPRGQMGDPRGQMNDPRGFPGGGEGGMGFGGPRVDARGLIGKFEYPNEEQNYRVEVTVSDRTGKKQPTKSSILVKVRG